jgi:CDP-diacylglycerol---glycerol-3-phosphate 3-phosphatidyltransferase
MSMLYAYKPVKDDVLRSASRKLLVYGVTPNIVTASGVLISLISGLIVISGHLYAGIIIFLICTCLDALDGSFARNCGLCTEFGRYFDSVCDRLSELIFIICAVIGGAPASAFVVVAGSFALLASRIYNHRKGISSDAAMFGRPERLALLIAGLLAPSPYNTILFMIAGLLCLISSAQALASGFRGRKSGDHLPKRDQSGHS